MIITYGITVCDEFEELELLLHHLMPLIDLDDEVIILRDITKTNSEVTKVINKYNSLYNARIQTIDSKLNKDFASFKNNLIERARGNYLFQIDADEIPHESLIEYLKPVLAVNSNVDCFYVPRVNKVSGITSEHIQKWGWHIDEKERINFPDLQMRIFKLNKGIKWKNKVHEVLENYEITSILPYQEDEEFCLYHLKTIKKQEAQNKFYEKI